ncbi:hypothetical protein K458DRAFT_395641 [Lentithecium fluviatile CBS 122367]|uniref:Transmembrane protein n=1 Tax=Lentithecium fluviatile CBS 122367 TaxID=1168545 RepID=A0A6G1IIA9_9PLEO|nr:hypothetical protein K458DRAFT_395641 [Lentithecium fluviatile CBS 122367]
MDAELCVLSSLFSSLYLGVIFCIICVVFLLTAHTLRRRRPAVSPNSRTRICSLERLAQNTSGAPFPEIATAVAATQTIYDFVERQPVDEALQWLQHMRDDSDRLRKEKAGELRMQHGLGRTEF